MSRGTVSCVTAAHACLIAPAMPERMKSIDRNDGNKQPPSRQQAIFLRGLLEWQQDLTLRHVEVRRATASGSKIRG
jgi:hypothetical protein